MYILKKKNVFLFNLLIKNNSYFKIFIIKNLKVVSKLFYEKAPQKLKKAVHRFVSSEAIKANSGDNLFSSVFFELRTKCSGQCSFCAASIQNDTRPDLTMDFDLYKKTILELSAMNYKGSIAFHVNSEPLLVKNLEEYISFSRKNLKNSWIQILTNGKSLNPINGKKIIDAGIDELTINVYNDDLKADLPNNIKNFENNVLNKLFTKDQVLTGHEEKRPDHKFIKYNVFKRLLNEVLTNRAGTAPNKQSNKPPPEDHGFCEYPFQQFNITANGDVSRCCCDLKFERPMGNIKFQGLKEIWFGRKFTALRKNLLEGNRKNSSICSSCDYYGVAKPPKNFLKKVFYYLLKHS